MTISRKNRIILNTLLVTALLAAALAISAVTSDAISGLEASGKIKVSSGAVLRAKASSSSKKIAKLKKGVAVEIKKEVFTSVKKSSSSYKWYYVNTGAGKGYVKSSQVKVVNYGMADGLTTKKVTYRGGAGSLMKKKGKFKKGVALSVVMQAKAKGSSAVWYKIKRGSKYYYLKASCVKISNIRSGLPDVSGINPAKQIVQSGEAKRIVNGTCQWAQAIADDNDFHYGKKPNSQHNGCYFCKTQKLKGGRSKKGVEMYETSYCCNPFVHAAFSHGGNEPTMLEICKKGSSYDYHKGRGYDVSPLFAKLGHPDMSLLKKGDVLCSNNHVMLYMGGGNIAEATGGDDNIPYSSKWNNSIRVCALTEVKYGKIRQAYRYIGSTPPTIIPASTSDTQTADATATSGAATDPTADNTAGSIADNGPDEGTLENDETIADAAAGVIDAIIN